MENLTTLTQSSEDEFESSMQDIPIQESGTKRKGNASTAKPPKHPSSDNDSVNSGKRKVSVWWDHFERLPDDRNRAACKYCKSVVGCSSQNGTSPLINHIKRCKNLPANMDKKQKLLEFSQKSVVRSDGVIETVYVPSAWKFSQEDCRKALAKMVVVDESPFAVVEHEGFRLFCKTMQPAFSIPSRTTVARDCYSLFFEEKKTLKDTFKKLSSRVSLTTDAWTSSQNLSYMCLTAHFIDDDWVLHKRIINFCPLAGHSGQLIGRAVEQCLVDWEIKNVMTVTVDNASSNDLAIDYLRRRFNHWESSILGGKYLHMRCVCHIMNLVVKDGLKDIDASIMRVRALVRYVRSSPARLQKFKDCVIEEKLDSKSLVCLDVETRWNSTYLMLQSAVKFKKAFDNLILRDSFCVKELKKGWKHGTTATVANDDDWNRVNSFLPILKVFYNATLKLSGSRYVTCNTVVEDMFGVGMVISNYCKKDDVGHKNMAMKMKTKYDKYWGDVVNINLLMFVAVFLDPCRKMKYVEFVVRKLFDDTRAKLLSLNITILLGELFDLYASSMPQEKKHQESSSSVTSNMDESELGDHDLDFSKVLNEEFEMEIGSHAGVQSELDKYMKDGTESASKTFSVLQWWKDNERRYPVLSKIARDVLAIPVSTVASESAFSTGGRVLDSFRTSLSPRMVEALICAQDWLRTSASPIIIEESLLAMEKFEEEVLQDLIGDHPRVIIEESCES